MENPVAEQLKVTVTCLKIKEKWIVQYKLEDNNGHAINLRMKVYYAPDMSEGIRPVTPHCIRTIKLTRRRFTEHRNY